jgi:Amt family ammonium transporter
VDDALGVVYTHGMAGLTGGLLLGIFGDPNMIQYGCGHLNGSGQVVATTPATYGTATAHCTVTAVNGLLYTGSGHQLWEQFRAAVFVIIWSAVITFILMKLIGLVLGGARYKDDVLEVGDLAIHGEEAFPEERLATRSDGAFAMAGIDQGGEPQDEREVRSDPGSDPPPEHQPEPQSTPTGSGA